MKIKLHKLKLHKIKPHKIKLHKIKPYEWITPFTTGPRKYPKKLKEFRKLMKAASHKERKILAELIGSGFGSSPDTLCNHICYLRAGSLGQLNWDESWKQVVTDVADYIGLDWKRSFNGRRWKHLKTREIESAVVAQLFTTMTKRLSSQQHQAMLNSIVQTFSHHTHHLDIAAYLKNRHRLSPTNLKDIGKMSHLGSTLLAQTVLIGIAEALGVKLPSAVVGETAWAITASSPQPWADTLGAVISPLHQPNWNKLTLAVLYVSMLRSGRYS